MRGRCGASGFKSKNSAIAVAEPFEDMEQRVNDIYLQTIASNVLELTNEQQFVLEFIANECPYTGGPAVFRARNMLMGYGEYIFDDTACNNLSQ